MRILTGGHAIWMGGWTCQVHHHQDVICKGGLKRSPDIISKMKPFALEMEAGLFMLPPAYALADSLIHKDHRVMPPDEIENDYLDQDEAVNLRQALKDFGCSDDEVDVLAAPYDPCLTPDIL